MSRSKKSSSAKSSEDSLCQDNGRRPTTRRTSQSSSTRRTVYPSVPRRVRPLPLIDDEELIDTESTIDILPSRSFSQNVYESSSNRNAYNRRTLDLLTKYTSPKKQSQQTSSPPTDDENSLLNDFDFIYGSKSKRTLSPLNETNQRMSQSKRTKAFIEEDDDEEENELSCFLDHRYAKRVPSQTTNQIEQKQPTKRKPTARNLNTNRSQTSLSQAVSIDIPDDDIRIESCEPMIDHEEINFVDRIDTSCLPKPTAMSTSRNRLITTPIDIQNKLTVSSTPIRSIKQISLNPTDRFSPSTNSLFFDTPNSSFSRLQINRTTSTPQIVSKTDCATEIIFPTSIDMIKQLITQINSTSNSIDINPNELAKQLFNQTISFSTMNKHQYIDLLPKKQLLYINRYEIEIIYPLENEKFSSIYVCDTCLKTFYGSSIAYQRHAAKCLSIQPPGKLIYTKDDLAIFQIGQTNVTFQQRIYMKFLYRLSRLFIDKEKAIDDTKLNSFSYYILCRKDTILSAIQPPVYRFIGYFSKQVNQSAQQMLNNFSCLFILPCLPRANEYNRFLISFSYLLNRCSNLVYSSPVRPLDNRTFSILQNYWREIFFTYLIHHNHSSIKPLALDAFARQTSIHPRDILLSLSTHDLLRSNPIDKSSIYLRVNAYSPMTHSNLDMKNEILFMDTNSIDINDEKKTISNESNTNKSHDSGIEEIVLD